jgi:outer membrane protein TolC
VKRFPVILAFLLPGLAATAADPVELTLEEAIATALARNRTLARGQMQLRGQEMDVALARTEFETEAGPVLQSARMGDDTQWTYGLQATKTTSYGTRLGASGTYLDRGGTAGGNEQALAVSLSQPLFRRFGRAVAEEPVRMQLDQYRAERRHWEVQRADLVMGLVTLFETLSRLDAHIAFETGYLERIRRLGTLVRAHERQGRSTRVDVVRMDLQGGEAQARLAALEERRDAASRELAEMLGTDLGTAFRPHPPPELDLALPRAEDAVAAAASNRLDLAQAIDDADVARRKASLSRRNRWPDISIGLSMRHAWMDTSMPGLDDERTDVIASAQVDGYPWRRADRLGTKRAELDEASAAAIVDIRREAIAREVLQTLADCRRAATELGIAVSNRKLAEDGARLARRLYEMGRGDAFTLSDAETQLARAESRLLEVRSSHRLSAYAVLHATGALIEHPDELKPQGD